MISIKYFWTLPLRQKARWIGHFLKVKFKHKERRRSLALASHVPRGGVIIDVGAHIGYLTKEFAQAHQANIQVIAFEPGDYCMSILRLTVKNLSNVTLVKAGLGNHDGFSELKLPIKKRGNWGIGLSQIGGDTNTREYLVNSVEVKKLDTYADETNLNRVDLLKVDVEGGELDILKGATKLIKKFKPIWYLEVDDSMLKRYGYSASDLFKFLENYNYKPYLLLDDGNLKKVDKYGESGDYFFKAE